MARLGRASTPLDLMTYDAEDLQPSLFLLKQTKRQSIITVFNWSETPRHHTLTRTMLQLDPKANYSVSEILAPTGKSNPLAATLDVQQPAHSVRIFKIVNTGILAKAPNVTANVASSGKAGESIAFHAVPLSDDDPVLHCIWDFGDGVTVEGANATHAYTHAGIYKARLKAVGVDAEPNSQTFSIDISGAIATKFKPESKRRFVEGQP
jgi:alpha-galactosidase